MEEDCQTAVVLDRIPFSCPAPLLARRMRVAGNPRLEPELAELLAQAQAVARPKAVYRSAPCRILDEDRVGVGGVIFTSRRLCRALAGVRVAHAFLATCGLELDAWSQGQTGHLHRFWAQSILDQALDGAVDAVTEHIFRDGQDPVCRLEPGVPDDWPVTQQVEMFHLLGEATADLGVRLGAACQMTPLKSVTGLAFSAPHAVHQCTSCPQGRCPNRSRPYVPEARS